MVQEWRVQMKSLVAAATLLLPISGRAIAEGALPATDVNLVSCSQGDVAACERVAERLNGNCADPRESDASKTRCRNEFFGSMEIVESVRRVNTACPPRSENSADCKTAKSAASKVAKAYALAFGIIKSDSPGSHSSNADFFDRIFNRDVPDNITSIIFTWPEQASGNCTTLSGARLEISPSVNGYVLHYVAQMNTSWSIWGDVWHVRWHFLDATGKELLVSREVDLPEGTRMHPQFGNNDIDFHGSIGPETQPRIQQVLHSIVSVRSTNSC